MTDTVDGYRTNGRTLALFFNDERGRPVKVEVASAEVRKLVATVERAEDAFVELRGHGRTDK
jgi:hypothetical protein